MNIKYIEGDKDLPSGYYCKVGNVFYLIEDLINNKDKEIERLNNIINKLEKWLEEESQEHRFYYEHDKADTLDIALYKLEELKGSDKE